MDSAMRDLERIEERPPDEGRAVLVLSAVGLLAAIGIVIAAVAAFPNDEPAPPEDLLQALTLPQPSQGAAEADEDDALDPKSLSFPTTLISGANPEVAAAVAAASAELAHMDPLVDKPPRAKIAAGLPAAVTAGPDREALEHAVATDPLVASTLPEAAEQTDTAPHGHEGLYTLQVISYDAPDEARLFADALRKRGHAAYVTRALVEDRGVHWRVRIGPFDNRQEAETYRQTFEREEGMNTFVVRRTSQH